MAEHVTVRPARMPAARRSRQRGSILLVSLVALLLLFIGALFTLRGVLTDTALTDAFNERQKATVASDLALQWAVSQIEATYQASQGHVLEISAAGKPWFRPWSGNPAAPVNPSSQPASQPNYWTTCENNPSSTYVCAPVTLANSAPQKAWVFVQPTGRSDPSACGDTQSLIAWYYDIWVHTVDPRTQTGVDTESLFKLCVAQ
jgi:Tfp pilus assembly protein PilX